MEQDSRPTSADVHARECLRIGRTPEVGLAISGGGIRSATFALGLLQALKRLGVFNSLDYVSTVSGGGYTGAWLYALQRRGKLVEALDLDGAEPRQVRFLRTYSNYLTPKLGLFSGDTWAAVGTVGRNLVVTFTVLSLSIVAVLYVPWIIHLTFRYWRADAAASPLVAMWLAGVAALLLFVAFATSAYNMARPIKDGTWRTDRAGWTSTTHVQVLVVLPILVAMAILGAVIHAVPADALTSGYARLVVPGVAYGGIWGLALAAAHLFKTMDARRRGSTANPFVSTNVTEALLAWVKLTAFAVPAGAIAGYVVTRVKAEWLAPPTPFAELGMPLLVAGLMLAIIAHIGLAGTLLSDETREWWARVGGQVLLTTLLLAVLILVAVYSPYFLARTQERLQTAGATQILTLLWAAITGSGLLAGRSSRTSNGGDPWWMSLAGKVAPFVFVVGYGVMLAVVLERVHRPNSIGGAGLWMLIFGVTAWYLSRRADLNEFSMHALYRNRLVRCYLGASNEHRKAHPFHGFDSADDVPLVWPQPPGELRPYPIFNAAINLVGGKNLAWQQRKAASFVFTPEVCGYEYRDDEQIDQGVVFKHPVDAHAAERQPLRALSAYSDTAAHGGGSLTVGLAMATSGAAASPNMGYHTSPTLAFLMTVFNVRLGWWLRNPRFADSWTRASKRLSLVEFVAELLGLTTDERDFVYLSDGGHFENLGLYELVRRRCPFVIVSDAGQDGLVTFEDLGNAIEKVRADFGIDIEIDISELRPANGVSRSHCAVGTIRYDRVDPDRSPGTLLFVKATVTGDEPTDVQRYAFQHAEFPHESTADQFFSESQFESYRALGYHIGRSVFDVVASPAGKPMSPMEMFRILRQRWTPAAPAPDDGVGRYSRALTAIWNTVRSDARLRFLDGQIFPEWAALMATGRPVSDLPPAPAASPTYYWLPESEDDRRSGFYVCNQVLQLMEDVYIEFRLDEYHDHIDNRGWMNLFQHWTWSGMLSATWAVTAATYDPRFQRFCAERLDLRTGRVRVPRDGGERLPSGAEWRAWTEAQRAAERQRWQAPALGLNFWEIELVAHFLVHTDHTGLTIHPIRVVVESPRRNDGHPFEFTAGYLILRTVGDQTSLVHMRVQNHLRKMGIAGTALRCLLDTEPGGWRLAHVVVEIPEAEPMQQSMSVDEALPRPAAARQIERWLAALSGASSHRVS
jgi:hypothetical protein